MSPAILELAERCGVTRKELARLQAELDKSRTAAPLSAEIDAWEVAAENEPAVGEQLTLDLGSP